MSDEQTTAPHPEADTAPPDEKGDALREVLGDDFEDFETFRTRKQEWERNMNKHNEAAATAAKEAAKARDELLQALASTKSEPKSQKKGYRPASAEEFARSLGYDPSADPDVWNSPVTLKDVYASYNGMMDWTIQRTTEHEDKLSNIESNVSSFTERFEKSEEGFAQFLASNTVDSLVDKYPEADRDELFSAIHDLADAGDDFLERLEERARRSHERLEARLSEREKERRAKKRAPQPYRGAGTPGAVAGEKMPANAQSPEFMQQFLRRFPAPSTGAFDEETV